MSSPSTERVMPRLFALSFKMSAVVFAASKQLYWFLCRVGRSVIKARQPDYVVHKGYHSFGFRMDSVGKGLDVLRLCNAVFHKLGASRNGLKGGLKLGKRWR